MSDKPKVKITEHSDGVGIMTITEHSDGGLKTTRIVPGEFRRSPSNDADTQLRREMWLMRKGLPVEFASVASWVDRQMAEEEGNA